MKKHPDKPLFSIEEERQRQRLFRAGWTRIIDGTGPPWWLSPNKLARYTEEEALKFLAKEPNEQP